jgi:ubiquinone biosynthesis protein UbiJ
MLSEYWQEEMPLIAKKRHVEKFNSEVDNLRADVARFEKKLAKLTSNITTSLPNNIDTNSNAVDSTH